MEMGSQTSWFSIEFEDCWWKVTAQVIGGQFVKRCSLAASYKNVNSDVNCNNDWFIFEL